jgi:GGDEF domain-containing protein
MQGIMLPEDREKLALLEREKHADLASVLTPTELEDYEMRTSQTTNRLRQALTYMNATEDEFRAIYRVQQPFADKLGFTMGFVPTMDSQEQRRAALDQIAAQLKTVLGDQRYADYARASNNEFQQLSRIAQSANIDNDTAIRTFNLRDSVSQESTRIYNDTTMSADQKRGALQLLAQNTKTQIVSALGQTAGDAYLQTAARWLNAVERGGAVSFGSDGSSMNTRMIGTRVARPASSVSP